MRRFLIALERLERRVATLDSRQAGMELLSPEAAEQCERILVAIQRGAIETEGGRQFTQLLRLSVQRPLTDEELQELDRFLAKCIEAANKDER